MVIRQTYPDAMRLQLEHGNARWEITVRDGGGLSLRRLDASYAGRLWLALIEAWERLVRAQREDVQARRLCELDARTLRDIGLSPDQGCAMGERIDAYRRQAELRAFQARLGI